MKSHIKITKNIFVLALVLAATGCDDSAKENSNSYSRNDNSQSSAEISSSEPVSSSSVSYSAVIGSGSGITYTDTPSSPGQIDPSTPSSANPSEHLTVKTITSKLYYKYKEKKDDDSYDVSDANEIAGENAFQISYKVGEQDQVLDNIGSLTITADCVDLTYRNNKSYFINGSTVIVNYSKFLPDALLDEDDNLYEIYSDKVESMAGHKVGEVGVGGYILLKSDDDGVTWNYDQVSCVNISSGITKYTPDGSDVAKGTLYKVITGYKLKNHRVVGQKKDWTSPFTYNWVDKYEDFYLTLIQESVFYIATNQISARFSSEETVYNPTEEEDSSISAEIINSMTSLTDGSVTFSDVTYSNSGQSDLICRYEYNDGEPQFAENGQVFSQKGKYHFKVSNPIGTFKEYTIYIVDKDTLFASYFGTGLLTLNRRIFDITSPYPVYPNGSVLRINANNPALPPLYGALYGVKNNQFDEKPVMTFGSDSFKEPIFINEDNIYCLDLYVGLLESAGQKINYRFYFKIVNRPDYQPTVNYNFLTSASRKINLSLKAYAVNFATTLGGSYVFLFPATLTGYQEASDFAYNMEKRFVQTFTEQNNVIYYYYRGVRYDSKIELYQVLSENAEDSVYLSYINPSEEYGIEVINESKLANIESTVLERDVRVCTSERVRNELLASDILLNGFAFTQVADFESESVTIVDDTGKEINVPYNKPIDEILDKTGNYTIKEKNWNRTIEYSANFIAKDDNTAEVNFALYNGETKSIYSLNKSNDLESFSADRLVFSKSNDVYDSQTIVIISGLGFRQTCLVSELGGKVYHLTQQGTYKIEIINRLGYSYSFNVEISGNYVLGE